MAGVRTLDDGYCHYFWPPRDKKEEGLYDVTRRGIGTIVSKVNHRQNCQTLVVTETNN